MIVVIQIAAVFGVPLLVLKRRDRGLARYFGTIAMAYVWGIAVALAVWGLNRLGLEVKLNGDVGQIGSYVCIGLAIPLLMFGANLKEIQLLTRKVLVSFGLLIAAVVVVVLVIGRTYGATFPWGRELAAMATGMYTGGSPNFNAIGVILGVDGDVIALGNLSDMLVGGLFYVFVLTGAKPILGRLLDRRARQGGYMKNQQEAANLDALEWNGFHRGLVRNLALSLGCVVLGGAVGLGLWLWRGGGLTDHLVPWVMLSGTVLGLALSFVPPVRDVPENGTAGHYLILVFSFALASSLDVTAVDRGFLQIVGLLALITVCSFTLHGLLCRLFRIDADCAIVTMTAGLYGPAFVQAVTRQLGNDKLTAPGLICGALGYAVGTILGTGIYLLL